VTKSNKRILAGALGFAAGVMLYVTCIEIFQKSLEGFVEAGLSGFSYAVATLTFFSGLLLMYHIFLFKCFNLCAKICRAAPNI
jgi:ZIP family zinc transporter